MLAVGGANGTPFPADGLIPFLKGFYDYSWVVGIVGAIIVYAALTLPTAAKGTGTGISHGHVANGTDPTPREHAGETRGGGIV